MVRMLRRSWTIRGAVHPSKKVRFKPVGQGLINPPLAHQIEFRRVSKEVEQQLLVIAAQANAPVTVEGVRESSSTTEPAVRSAIDVRREDFETFARWRPLLEIARYACEKTSKKFDFAVDIADDMARTPAVDLALHPF